MLREQELRLLTCMHSRERSVYVLFMRCSAAAMKSVKVFFFCLYFPSSYLHKIPT